MPTQVLRYAYQKQQGLLRKDEVEGVDYFFKNDEEFILMIKNDEFIENATVFGNYYGTSEQWVITKN